MGSGAETICVRQRGGVLCFRAAGEIRVGQGLSLGSTKVEAVIHVLQVCTEDVGPSDTEILDDDDEVQGRAPIS